MQARLNRYINEVRLLEIRGIERMPVRETSKHQDRKKRRIRRRRRRRSMLGGEKNCATRPRSGWCAPCSAARYNGEEFP